jgi:hypothetical protein
MTSVSRTRPLLGLASLLLTATVGLTACGGGDDSSATADSAPTSTPTSAPTSEPTSAPTSDATDSGDSQTGTLVRIDQYGVSYRVPKGWISVDGKDLLKPDNPVLKEVAEHMGVSVDQLISSIGTHIQAYSVSDEGANGGLVDNVNALGVPTSGLTAAQLKVQLAGIGAKPGKVVQATTPAGHLTRLSYRWTTNGITINGVSMAVDLGTSTVQVTVSAHDAATAGTIADLVQSSLRPL